ncbi:hypothetical protein NP233_g1655 [Leucocoprinus birnbaumii]|uniref:F-box domain-containing protein n=1 Tax=Leucocoprinus birnbaumii TaxID=56174 RepID=A0AAD5W3N6_9AGAR|nr:hypothetical protein NP233_g1655 [Leucocoprinus birnbaumii]
MSFLSPFASLLSEPNITYPPMAPTLPHEVLCRIFQESLDYSPFYHRSYDQDGDINLSCQCSRMTTPLTLSAVCQLWRRVAFGDPQLWRNVYLVASPWKAEAQSVLLREWLSRAGILTLDIDIDCPVEDDKRWSPENKERSHLILRVVYEYSHRCTTFRTRLPPSCLSLPWGSSSLPRWTKLTSLDIATYNLTEGVDGQDEEDLDSISVFRHSRQLRHLTIWEIRIEQLHLPWSHLALASISTQALTVYDCLVLLRNAPNVEECLFSNVTYPNSEELENFQDYIHLPQLHTLHLDFTELGGHYGAIFNHITTPNLRALSYYSEEGSPFPAEEFQEFLQRSCCPLISLEIKGSDMSAPAIWNSLRLIPQSLEQVFIEAQDPTGEGPMITFVPYLKFPFPRIRAATFRAPRSVVQELESLITMPH